MSGSPGTSSTASIIHRAKENGLARLLRSCAELQDLAGGKRVHARIEQTEHRGSVYLANLLIHMYARCGSVNSARQVFDRIQEPNRFSWNIITCAYATNGFAELAAAFYHSMPEKTVVACTAVIEALGHLGQVDRAKALFDAFPAPARDLVCSNAMLSAYARNGHLDQAEGMLREMEYRNVVSWNTTLLGYAEHGDPKDAKRIFQEMPHRNEVVWMALIAAFAEKEHLRRAESLFELMPCHNAGTWSVLIAMHSRRGDLTRAEKMFRKMRLRNRAAWAAMFHGYLRAGQLALARELLERMPQQGMDLASALITAYLERDNRRLAKKIFDRLPLAAADHRGWTSLLKEKARDSRHPDVQPDREEEPVEEKSPRSREDPPGQEQSDRSRPVRESGAIAKDGRECRAAAATPATTKKRDLRQRLPAASHGQLRALKQRILLMPRPKRLKWTPLLKRMRAEYVLRKWSSSKIWPGRERHR